MDELLPDENAQLVAQAVEAFALDDAAAPNAHKVHAGVLAQRQKLGVALLVHQSLAVIHRNKIDALDVDALAVDQRLIG